MSDRGDYRSMYVAFSDDPDVHGLSDRAYRLLRTLKDVLPAAGIGVVYDTQLREQIRGPRGCTQAQLEAAFAELEGPKRGRPEGSRGWIVRDRNVVWIVNGLRFEPSLSPQNRKHCTFVARAVAPLGDAPIVEAFRAYYADWFPPSSPAEGWVSKGHREPNGGASSGNGMGIDTPSNGYRMPIDRVSKHSDSDSDIPSLTSDSDTRAREDGQPPAPAASPASPAAQVAPGTADAAALPAGAEAWLARFYPLPDPRHAEKREELGRVLTSGASFRRRRGATPQVVRATAARLEVECRRMLTEPPPQKPQALLLIRLLEDPETNVEGRTVTEQMRHDTRKRVEREDREGKARLAEAERWLAANPDATPLLEAELRGVRADRLGYSVLRDGALLRLFDQAAAAAEHEPAAVAG